MDNNEILVKTIKKICPDAENIRIFGDNIQSDVFADIEESSMTINIDFEEPKKTNNAYFAEVNTLIFSHQFAKAFWGEEKIKHIIKSRNLFEQLPIGLRESWISLKETELEVWQYHLQQMVLEPDPIKYLEKWL